MHWCRFAMSRRGGGAGPACCPPSSSAGPSFPSSALFRVVGSARMLGALGLRPMHGAGGIGQGQWRGCLRPTGMERRPLLRHRDGAAAARQAARHAPHPQHYTCNMRTHMRSKKNARPRFARPRRLKAPSNFAKASKKKSQTTKTHLRRRARRAFGATHASQAPLCPAAGHGAFPASPAPAGCSAGLHKHAEARRSHLRAAAPLRWGCVLRRPCTPEPPAPRRLRTTIRRYGIRIQ